MRFSDWVEANRARFGSDYEVLFAERVLPLVDGLTPEVVELQHPFVDSDGKARYCDFVIVESQAVRVAIEIDGYDKRGTGQGMSYVDFLDWQRRQASLASQGWHVLRFANRDVRDEPLRCAEYISRLLSRLRQAEAGRVEIVTLPPRPPASAVPAAEAVVSATPQVTHEARTSRKGGRVWMLVGLALLIGVVWQVHLAQFGPQAAALSSAQALVPSVASETAPPKNSGLEQKPKWSYGKLDCRDALDWSVAKTRVGQVVTVMGPLLETRPRPNVAGSPMWLDVGAVHPRADRLTIVLWGRNWHKFDMKALDADRRQQEAFDEHNFATICVRGRVADYRGVPQIELQEPSQVVLGWHPRYRQ